MVNPDPLYMNRVAADVSPRTLKVFSADSRRRLRFVVQMLSQIGAQAIHHPIIGARGIAPRAERCSALLFIAREHGLQDAAASQANNKNHAVRRCAFTLTELLVVCAVIGILASLITTSIMSARAKARRVQCLANLHQHGIALNVFLADHHEYPLFNSMHVEYQDNHIDWRGTLFPEQAYQGGVFRGFPKVFDCPAAAWPTIRPAAPAPRWASYGYNAWGLGGTISQPVLGIGGTGPVPAISGRFMVFDNPPPVRELDVVNPSEMLAIGDGFRGWKGTIADLTPVLGRAPDAWEVDPGSARRSHRRHSGRANVLFCDGHVDSLKLQFLFQDETDQALRIWNRDNQPHRERLNSLK